MFGMSNFKSSSNSKSSGKSSRGNDLESLVRIALTNGELAPGVAAQIGQYRNGKLNCEERRLLAILDDAIADGCVVPVEMSFMKGRRQVAYSLG